MIAMYSRPRSLQLGLGVLVLLWLARPAAAQADDPRRALAEYKLATTHYNLNEFEDAIKHYREAYRLKSDPAFLFNIGQSYRQLGDYDNAIRFYRSYLRDLPDAPNRVTVEARISEMQEALKIKSRAPTDPMKRVAPDEPPARVPDPARAAQTLANAAPPPEHAPPPRERRRKGSVLGRWWFWTAVGVVAIGGTVAIVAASGDGGGTDVPQTALGAQEAF